MSSELQEIEDLIARMALKDRGAFRNVYSRTSAKLFGVVLRVLDDRAEAEDVLQDVYVKVWNNADRYRANGLSPMTWLITIARNAAIDRKRRARHSTSGDVLTATRADPLFGPLGRVLQGRAIAAREALNRQPHARSPWGCTSSRARGRSTLLPLEVPNHFGIHL